ncbi:MAG: TRAP transporter large permease subunit [Pseudomonadota bacterium]|nr:TRAP transporter large permease subunit [Pseudomonadota bacterium]MEE2859665.1 TRAP transporter large permease subunit [Pseudomonadota bacterium]
MDLVLFGLMLAKVLEVGMITPPVGLNVFVVQSVSKGLTTLEQLFIGVLPFIVMDLLLIVLLIIFVS